MASRSHWSRRGLLQGAAAFGAAMAAGVGARPARAATGERKFIFFFASGGWDTTTVFDPHFGSDGVDMDRETFEGSSGNLIFTDGADRDAVARFFRRWGRRSAIVNGVNAHSVGHESAAQFVLTGTSSSSFADWPTILAANAAGDYPLPHVVFSGPNYPGTSGAAVVRAGGGTLLDLIDGAILGDADVPTPLPSTPADSMVDAFVYERAARFAAAQSGLGSRRAEALLANLERGMELEGRRFEAGLDELGTSILDQAVKASELMRLGLSRTAMIGIPGGWDSHGDESVQAPQFNSFFDALDQLMDHLSATPGQSAASLIDEVVLVAMSEFGRTPTLNGGGGKDHWPYGSALVVGSGVNGNRRIGVTNASLVAEPIDFSTGQASASGELPGCENLGVALLKLGGLDPQKHLPDVQVLEALLR